MRTGFCNILAASAGIGLWLWAVIAPAWTITDLGVLSGTAGCKAKAINNLGQVVGYCSTPSEEHAFLWSRSGGMIEFGRLPGWSSSQALAINDRGQVVGCATEPSRLENPSAAFVWTGAAGMQALTPARTRSCAVGINNAGQIVGSVYRSDGRSRAIVWSTAGMRDLGTPPGWKDSAATSINDRGLIVGSAQMPPLAHTFLLSGGMRDLGGVGDANGIFSSYASSINNRGDVVGASAGGNYTTTRYEAVQWSGGKLTRLARLPDDYHSGPTFFSWAHDINDKRQAVGYVNRRVGQLAVLWVDGAVVNLSALPEVTAAGWEALREATAINNTGQIVGWGSTSSGWRAFLLSPGRVPARGSEA